MSAFRAISTAPGAIFHVSPKDWTVPAIRDWLRYFHIPGRSVARKPELLQDLRRCEMTMDFEMRMGVVDFILQHGHRLPPRGRLPTAPNLSSEDTREMHAQASSSNSNDSNEHSRYLHTMTASQATHALADTSTITSTQPGPVVATADSMAESITSIQEPLPATETLPETPIIDFTVRYDAILPGTQPQQTPSRNCTYSVNVQSRTCSSQRITVQVTTSSNYNIPMGHNEIQRHADSETWPRSDREMGERGLAAIARGQVSRCPSTVGVTETPVQTSSRPPQQLRQVETSVPANKRPREAFNSSLPEPCPHVMRRSSSHVSPTNDVSSHTALVNSRSAAVPHIPALSGPIAPSTLSNFSTTNFINPSRNTYLPGVPTPSPITRTANDSSILHPRSAVPSARIQSTPAAAAPPPETSTSSTSCVEPAIFHSLPQDDTFLDVPLEEFLRIYREHRGCL